MRVIYENADTFTITRFKDGDTCLGFLKCNHCGTAIEETVRLLKIESWELDSRDCARARTCASALTDMYRGKLCHLSTRSIRRDKYGRILADLIHNGQSIADTIVTAGLGWYGVGEPQPGPYS